MRSHALAPGRFLRHGVVDETSSGPGGSCSPSSRLALAASIVLGVASAAGDEAARTSAASPNLLLGITGDVARYKSQTGLDPTVVQAFLGWGQGQNYGAPFAAALPDARPRSR